MTVAVIAKYGAAYLAIIAGIAISLLLLAGLVFIGLLVLQATVQNPYTSAIARRSLRVWVKLAGLRYWLWFLSNAALWSGMFAMMAVVALWLFGVGGWVAPFAAGLIACGWYFGSGGIASLLLIGGKKWWLLGLSWFSPEAPAAFDPHDRVHAAVFLGSFLRKAEVQSPVRLNHFAALLDGKTEMLPDTPFTLRHVFLKESGDRLTSGALMFAIATVIAVVISTTGLFRSANAAPPSPVWFAGLPDTIQRFLLPSSFEGTPEEDSASVQSDETEEDVARDLPRGFDDGSLIESSETALDQDLAKEKGVASYTTSPNRDTDAVPTDVARASDDGDPNHSPTASEQSSGTQSDGSEDRSAGRDRQNCADGCETTQGAVGSQSNSSPQGRQERELGDGEQEGQGSQTESGQGDAAGATGEVNPSAENRTGEGGPGGQGKPSGASQGTQSVDNGQKGEGDRSGAGQNTPGDQNGEKRPTDDENPSGSRDGGQSDQGGATEGTQGADNGPQGQEGQTASNQGDQGEQSAGGDRPGEGSQSGLGEESGQSGDSRGGSDGGEGASGVGRGGDADHQARTNDVSSDDLPPAAQDQDGGPESNPTPQTSPSAGGIPSSFLPPANPIQIVEVDFGVNRQGSSQDNPEHDQPIDQSDASLGGSTVDQQTKVGIQTTGPQQPKQRVPNWIIDIYVN